ncbi:MAG: Hsp20/alpha crystallin family protein [Acidobacteria bacterium]|nr:Hsp20/alpha crystallin family protein [Acidobacteriota bacterium]
MAKHWDPIRDLVTLQERMNRLFEDATERRAHTDEENDIERADWTPAADVYNRETDYVIMIDLPGIDRETLDISVDENRLWIRGTRSIEQDAQQRMERPHGNFLRKFGPLPPTIDQQAIKADYKDGVLRLTLPKREEQKSRRVEIKVQ